MKHFILALVAALSLAFIPATSSHAAGASSAHDEACNGMLREFFQESFEQNMSAMEGIMNDYADQACPAEPIVALNGYIEQNAFCTDMMAFISEGYQKTITGELRAEDFERGKAFFLSMARAAQCDISAFTRP